MVELGTGCLGYNIFRSYYSSDCCKYYYSIKNTYSQGRGGRDRMVVGFTTNCAISAYHHQSCEFELRLWGGVLYTTLCDISLSVT